MAWLIVSKDSEQGPAMRADKDLMDAMWAYELANRDIILAAGSLREDDGETKIGSIYILDLPSRAAAEAFFAEDAATKAGMRGETEITWLNVAILDHKERP